MRLAGAAITRQMCSQTRTSPLTWLNVLPRGIRLGRTEHQLVRRPGSGRSERVLRVVFGHWTGHHFWTFWRDHIVPEGETVEKFRNAFSPRALEPSYRCPCCRYVTLEERGSYDICPICFWEDDGQDDHDADVVRGGPNGRLSLIAARKNFDASGASEPRRAAFVRSPTPSEHHARRADLEPLVRIE
jgi:hypothetical protein